MTTQKRILSDWISGWMAWTEHLESPRIYSEWVAVSTLASAMSRNYGIVWDRKVFPNLYIFLVGPPGARKGTALNPSRPLLDSIGVTLAPSALTRRRFLSILEAASAGGVKKLSGFISPISALTILSSEMTVFINRDNMTMVKDLTDLYDYDADVWTYETETSGKVAISKPFVNMIGATQPGMLARMLPDESVSLGFMSRVVAVYEDKRHKKVTFPMDVMPPRNKYKALETDLHTIASSQGWFKIDQSFRDVYAPWYEHQEQDMAVQEERLAEYVHRRPTLLQKLCMVMNVSRNGGFVLTSEDFNRALDLMKRTEENMNRSFVGMGRADNAEVMELVTRFIFQVQELPYSKLLRRFFREVDDQRLAVMVATLEKMGEIEILPIKNSRDNIIKVKGGKK